MWDGFSCLTLKVTFEGGYTNEQLFKMVESKGSRPFKASFGTQGWDAMKFSHLTLVTDGVCTLSTN